MARVHASKRIITVKLVYYGPGLSGKTTNLKVLHERYPGNERGALVTLDTETERTLFFDYFPANLGAIAGYLVLWSVKMLNILIELFYVFVSDKTPSHSLAQVM